jgi:hypothetical protein
MLSAWIAVTSLSMTGPICGLLTSFAASQTSPLINTDNTDLHRSANGRVFQSWRFFGSLASPGNFPCRPSAYICG